MIPEYFRTCKVADCDNSSGVYLIYCSGNRLGYVGSSVRLWERWTEHLSQLGAGKHVNRYLQRCYNKYKKHTFAFYVLQRTPGASFEERTVLEGQWWDKLAPGAWLNCGRPQVGIPISEEAESRRVAALRNTYATQEARDNVREAVAEAYKDPIKRKRQRDAAARAVSDPGFSAKVASGVAKTWADPTVRARRVAAMTAAAQDPEARRERGETVAKNWKENRDARVAAAKEAQNRPEVRLARSKAMAGEGAHSAKLTSEAVRAARLGHAKVKREGGSVQDYLAAVAKEHGVAVGTVFSAVHRHTWKQLDPVTTPDDDQA